VANWGPPTIDATALIVRAPGGGGTRLGLGEEVAIRVG
jgi:hypothetical protein